MSERLSTEQFASYIAQQPAEQLPELAQTYHSRRNSGIKRLIIGAVATGGVVTTILATNGEAWRYVAMGELFVGATATLSGMDRFFSGRRGEQAAHQELESRSQPEGFLSGQLRDLMNPNLGREGMEQIGPQEIDEGQ